MRKRIRLILTAAIFCALALSTGSFLQPAPTAAAEIAPGPSRVTPPTPEMAVTESARDIPVAYDVDVVVVGGSSAGVEAAVEAAHAGAKVFLAAQRPYLGEDICGTYRLWLNPGEQPRSDFEKALFAESRAAPTVATGLKFTYQASTASATPHKDTKTPSVLCDGKYQSASSQSVQYDGDVDIIADLGSARNLKAVYIMAYQRRDGADDDFEVDRVIVSASDDKKTWTELTTIKNPHKGQSFRQPWGPVEISAPIDATTRYLKFSVKKNPDLARQLLGEIIIEEKSSRPAPPANRMPPAPMQVKRTLDNALINAGVSFLYGCYASDVLTDSKGQVAGIIMANRGGRQAVKAKVIIDATPRASLARQAGARFTDYPAGPETFQRTVVGGKLLKDLPAQPMPTPVPARGDLAGAVCYTLKIPMKDGSWPSFARAEQIARDMTWRNDQGESAEQLFQVPPDQLRSAGGLEGPWPGADKVRLSAFRPRGISRILVLGGCADISRAAAADMLRPLEHLRVGARVGAAAAKEAAAVDKLEDVRLRAPKARPVASGSVRENLSGIRNRQQKLGVVQCDEHAVPVLGRYDVVVIGGGTGGSPAAISAARQGVKTLLVEYLNGLGGVGTMGLISSYYFGNIRGFTAEVNKGVADLGGLDTPQTKWNPQLKSEWYREQLRKAGADVWFRSLGCGAFVYKGKVCGVVVATPQGRGVVLAKVVIDSTGNSDIAADAGAQTTYTDANSVAVQGSGLPPWTVGNGYTNTDWTFIDDSDPVDAWRSYVTAKSKYTDAYDLGQLLDTRERRRIVGDFTMSPMDIALGRTYPDTIVIARSNFDTHGYTIHPMFLLKPPDKTAMYVNVPIRCLLPKGLDGILVTGLSVSAHRDAMPVIRMQADVQNQGYAAGVAASMASRTGKPLRKIDIKALQGHLIDKGNLPQEVLTEKDSMPLSRKQIADAVQRVADNFDGLAIVLAQPKDSMPMLRQAYAKAEKKQARLAYAHILGMLGDNTGADELVNAVSATDWDKGWNYTGMGQYGPSISALDSLIIALGRTGDPRAVDVIAAKVAELTPESEFSHCRAVAMAFESLSDPRAAKSIAELLEKPGMMGHAFTNINDERARTPSSSSDNSTRNAALKELILARALYRCGDYQGLGEKILKQYSHDLRAHFARHAAEVLAESKNR